MGGCVLQATCATLVSLAFLTVFGGAMPGIGAKQDPVERVFLANAVGLVQGWSWCDATDRMEARAIAMERQQVATSGHVGVGFIGLATSLPVYLTARYGLDARLGSEVPFGVGIGAGLAPSAAFTYGAGAGVWVAPTVTAELGVGLPEPIFRDSAFWAMQLLKLQVRADLPAVSASDLTWEHVSAVLVWRGRFPV